MKNTAKKWYMLSFLGKDQRGIVAEITKVLSENQCNLGETAMNCLGGNFTVMLMVATDKNKSTLQTLLQPVITTLNLVMHIDNIENNLHIPPTSDVHINIHCKDRTGIIAEATQVLSKAGLNILDLGSEVTDTKDSSLYIVSIIGQAQNGIKSLQEAAKQLEEKGISIHIETIDMLFG